MRDNYDLVHLRQVWGDKVKGSWWKSLLLFLLYFILLITFQISVMKIGIKMSGEAPTIHNHLDMDYLFENIQSAQWWYHLYTFILIVILLSIAKNWKMKFFDLHHIKKNLIYWTLRIYIGMFVIQFIYSLIISYVVPDFETTSNQEVVNQLFMQMHWFGAFLNIVILTPILEEFLIRGLIMKYIFPLTPIMGFLTSTMTFTFLHSPSNLIDFFVYLIMALSISYVYWRTRRLEYPILFHMVNNGIAFIVMIINANG